MSLTPLIQRTLNSLLKLGDLTDITNIKKLLWEHFASAYPLTEAYQSSYTDTLEAIRAALSPGWTNWLGAKRKRQFIAQVVHYYLVDFAQLKGWSPEGAELAAFKQTVAQQCQVLVKDSVALFQVKTLPPFTEAELAGIVTVKGLPSVTQLVLERLRSLQIRLPEAEVLAFLQHQELLGKGIEFFLRHHPGIAAHLQSLQTAGLWDMVQNVENELAALKRAGVEEEIRVEDEFKAYDSETLKRVGQAVVLLRKRAVKPAEACQALLMAGSAVFSLGEMGQAKQLLEEALQLAQNDTEAALVHFNLFQVYLREDTTTYNEVAFYHLQTALALDAQYRFYEVRKYQLQRLLGAGGMGCAFVAQELVFQRAVVIKWFWQKFSTEKEVQQVFREALLMKRVPREYVPEPLDVSLLEDSACLITEYLPAAIDGESWLRSQGPLSAKVAVSVALQLARGLQAAHQQGIWHLDLKPANVLLYREGAELVAKIIDFGLARLAQPLQSQVRRSQKQSSHLGFRLAGTWDYAAPEQRGSKVHGLPSAKSDVYGLGKTLMRLCTGNEPQSCRERDMPVELREVVFDCIEESPAKRPDSQEVIARLQGVVGSREAEEERRHQAEMAKQQEEVARQQKLQEQREREEVERRHQAEMAKQREEVARQQKLQEQREREEVERQRQAEMAKQQEEVARQQKLREQREREEAERRHQAEMAKPREEAARQRSVSDLTIIQQLQKALVLPPREKIEWNYKGYQLDANKQVVGLSLYKMDLKELPKEVWQLTQLQELFLSHNQLTQLPPEMGQLTQLQVLNLDYNQLTQLLPEIGQLTQLRTLALSGNKLTQLPPEIGRLTQLQTLLLLINQLTRLPPEIGRLTQLQTLDLSENKLTQLPPEIGQLTQLQTLLLLINQLTQLPPEIGRLTQLQTLNLDYNQLTQLPPEIGRLTQLQTLGLECNQLTQLSPEIGQLTQLLGLDLEGNQLTQLPPEIGQLTQLWRLYLRNNRLTQLPKEITSLNLAFKWEERGTNGINNLYGNPLRVPPPEVIEQGQQAVIAYFQKSGDKESTTD